MQISRRLPLLATLVLVLGLGACASRKSDTDKDGAAGGAAGADGASATAGGLGGGLDSQSLGGANGGPNAPAGSPLSIRVFHFDYDSADLQPDDYTVLKAHAQYLAKTASARLLVGGHTDERGTREYNMALGERRAKAVAAFLTTSGAKPAQVEVVSYGEEKPLKLEETEAAWADNRRVELNYSAGKPSAQ